MSARRLQPPTPIGVTEYKFLSTSIVTTLAVLPQTSGATDPQEALLLGGGGAEVHDLFEAVQDTSSITTSSCSNALKNAGLFLYLERAQQLPPSRRAAHPLLDVKNISAGFEGPKAPASVRPEIWTKHANGEAVQEILETCEKGSEVETLIEKRFPNGDFQSHLFAYIRENLRFYKKCPKGTLLADLMEAYVTGFKEWGAKENDAFISRIDWALMTHAKSGKEAAGGQQDGEELAPWTPDFLTRAAIHQETLMKLLAKVAYKANPNLKSEWRKYKKALKLPYEKLGMLPDKRACKVMMGKGPHFISCVLRHCSPEFFLDHAANIAQTIKSFGGPCHLVNVMRQMSMHAEDVAEYEQMKRSVKGGGEIGFQEKPSQPIPLPPDLHMRKDSLKEPLSPLDRSLVRTEFQCCAVPPFLQMGYAVDEINTKGIKAVAELYEEGKKDEALACMNDNFSSPEDFHKQLFGLFRKAMRSQAFVPELPKKEGTTPAWFPYDFTTPLGRVFVCYVEGLRTWCADAHKSLGAKFEDMLKASEKMKAFPFRSTVEKIQNAYVHDVSWLLRRLPPNLINSEVASHITRDMPFWRLQTTFRYLDCAIRKMPWDYFLFYRTQLAAAVRQVNTAVGGFSFLANVLESVSFGAHDVSEFEDYVMGCKY
eukprot:Blabericola_migrator_1__0@NODE_1000_length_5738_cov_115_968612_g688_i0_p2_GENE_NODE_1000_length_5738_cov_115_968612_g688_i0NODE_1000_length_5738_cov_115_968612_g688_i0_p2_ORF_typecomplete_len652_score109_60TRF/PF08558_10/9_2TRF/PF08558_10/1_3e03TRF/PF08558_10/19DUF3517/PF12030_8/7_2DUF3517/PF12030_8/31_NODE_1000_length_5738_cov_115_968612_g688_i035075462